MLDIGKCEIEKHKENIFCPVARCIRVIGGKWKILILNTISKGENRFSNLGRALPDISKQMLTTQLRELEEDGIISRTIYPVIPPRVEYAITKYGETLFPIIHAMRIWGEIHQGND